MFIPTHQYNVDGHTVAVFDGLLSSEEIARIYKDLSRAPFVRREAARPDTAHIYRHWVTNVAPERARELRTCQLAIEVASELLGNEKQFRMLRSYCNFSSYGDILFSHTDCPGQAGEFTALWYICPAWDVEWGGETLFFNATDDAVCVVSPRPGRLVVFSGAIRHVGRPPTRICVVPRFTFAVKLGPVSSPEPSPPEAASGSF
jgi:SM-20-related protein